MAVNDVKTWIGSTGPYLSDSSKAVSGLQTDKVPIANNDVIRLIDNRNLGNPVVVPTGVDFIIKPNYQLIVGNQIVIQGTLDIQGELIVEEIPIVLTAADVVNVPAGSIVATNVQSAISELDTEKAPALGPDDNYVTDAEKIIIGNTSGTNTGDNATNSQYSGLAASKEDKSNKDATGGYVGLTLFKINFKNAANTFTNFFTNATTAAREYTFPNKDITVAGLVDITGTNSGTNTGDQVGDGVTITGAGTAGDPFVSSASGVLRAQVYAIGSLRI